MSSSLISPSLLPLTHFLPLLFSPFTLTQEESSTDEEEDEVSILFNPLITIVISSGIVLSLSFVSILICMVQRNKSRNSDDSGSSEGRKSNYKSSPSLSQSYGSNGRTVGNGGGGYVTTEEGLLLKTLNEGMRGDRNGDSHHHHHTPFAAYSIVGCKSPTLGSSCVDTLKVITDSELDHELMVGRKEPGGGYHTTTSSRVYCEEGNGTGTTRYTSVGPVIDYRPHYEYSTLGGTRTGSDLDSCQSIQFHLHPQNMIPPVSSCSESAFADSPSNPYFGQVSYEVGSVLSHSLSFTHSLSLSFPSEYLDIFLILSVHLLHRVSLSLFFFLRGDCTIGGDFLFHPFLPARSPWNVSFGTWKQSNLLPWI